MKATSAALIVLSGSVIFSAGLLTNGDDQTAGIMVGTLLGIVGLVAWVIALAQKEPPA